MSGISKLLLLPIVGSICPIVMMAAPFKFPAVSTTRPAVARNDSVHDAQLFDDLHRFRRIAFVMECDGDMINSLAPLKSELRKSINSLLAEQSFNLIFFQSHSCDQLSKELLTASAQNKDKADRFLEGVMPAGTTNPIPGIEAAFKQHPDVIYLVTDGGFSDNDAVLRLIRDLNKKKEVHVYTMELIPTDDTDVEFARFLKTIAAENDGRYRHVNANDL